MHDWAEGRWCDVCHQKHYQIHPPCLERRRQLERLRDLAREAQHAEGPLHALFLSGEMAEIARTLARSTKM